MNSSSSPSSTAASVAGLESGPLVLDHLVGVKDVVSNLVAKGSVDVLALQCGGLLLALLELDLEQLRAEHPHRRLAVLELGSLG